VRFEGADVVSAFAAFARLTRPKFLIGGLLGGALGTSIAAFERGGVDWAAFALAQSTITALHLMVHYSNDYFDRQGDALAVRTPFSGGSGALVDGSLAPNVALVAATLCLAAGLAGAAVLWVTGHGPAAWIALCIAVLAWSYSAPPLRLLARGLGELDTTLVVAVLVPLCAYAAQAGWPDLRAVAGTLPAAGAMFAMMIAVEYPDVEADAVSGKRTLVVRLGRERAPALAYLGLASIAAGATAALVSGAPPSVGILALAATPTVAGYVAALRGRVWTTVGGNAELAARGVSVFLVTSFATTLAYAAWP
jgi:1,4-dihydroxy-2-naphthoate polyprenyltransferase